ATISAHHGHARARRMADIYMSWRDPATAERQLPSFAGTLSVARGPLLALGDDGLKGDDDPIGHAPLVIHGGSVDRLVQTCRDPDRQPVVAWLLALRHFQECHAKAVGTPTYRHPYILFRRVTYKV